MAHKLSPFFSSVSLQFLLYIRHYLSMRNFRTYGFLLAITAFLFASCGQTEEFCVSCQYAMPCIEIADTSGHPLDTICQVAYETDSEYSYRFSHHLEGHNWVPVDTLYTDSGYYIQCFEGPDLANSDSILRDSMGWHCHRFSNYR